MPYVEVSLPDHVDSEIDRLVEQGEFVSRDQAIEELLSMGITAFGSSEPAPPDRGEELFTQAIDDQQDPAMRDESEEERTF